jgi:outer membrane protein
LTACPTLVTNGSVKTVLAVSLVCLAMLAPLSAAQAEDFAVVDVKGAMFQTEDGMRAAAQMKKLSDRRQKEIDGKQTSLAQMKIDIERQARFLSRQALTRRMELWQKEMVTLQSVYLDYTTELEKKQKELTAPILQKMIGLITKVARQNGYDIVFDRQAAAYARPDLDITDKIVQMYNAGEGG